MNDNRTLVQARRQKQDEFYTQLVDIENELRHYKAKFAGKVVYCNCDDPYESNFFKFFAANFNSWGLKKLVATCYSGSPISGEQLSLDHIDGIVSDTGQDSTAYKIEITSVTDLDGDGAIALNDVKLLLEQNGNVVTPLTGNGDFRSPECIALLGEADIVVTNPPFSLFREYVAQLIEHDKQFLIVGHQNAITYKEVFPLIQDGKMWLGYGFKGGATHFTAPHYQDYAASGDHRVGMIRVSGVVWFTNLDHRKRHKKLPLYKEYTPDEYPHYDNFDAINVDKTADIPEDYDGTMGVPITFLDKHNPDQFEILGITKTWFGAAIRKYPPQIQVSASGQRSEVTKLNDGPALLIGGPIAKTYYMVGDNYFRQLYARILIGRKR
jgi:hypothetical protein